eukprot:2983002-Pleurochrysis_carterae.AAC.1
MRRRVRGRACISTLSAGAHADAQAPRTLYMRIRMMRMRSGARTNALMRTRAVGRAWHSKGAAWSGRQRRRCARLPSPPSASDSLEDGCGDDGGGGEAQRLRG